MRLSRLRALSVNELPPNPVVIGLALFLTLFVMAPVGNRIHDKAWKPYRAGEASIQAAGTAAWTELSGFLVANTRESELTLFAQMADVQLELGAFCFVALFAVLTLVGVAYDREALWDRVEELLGVEWLDQESDGALFQRTGLDLPIAVAGDDDDGQGLLHGPKPILKTLPGQSGHPQIENDTTVSSHPALVEKFIGRAKNLVRKIDGVHESCHRNAYGGIVIDNEYGRRLWWWRFHSRLIGPERALSCECFAASVTYSSLWI